MGTHIPDVALLETPPTSDPLPDITIRTQPLRQGKSVYFINYQPTANHKLRTPNPIQVNAPYDQPAIYGGIILRLNAVGQLEVITAIKNFGAVPDVSIRPGASGGAVVDSAGKLVGFNIAYTPTQFTARQFESIDGAKLTSANVGEALTMAYVQPLTTQLLGSLSTELALSPQCTLTSTPAPFTK